ncbi:MAG: type II toxin-antitoxin system RelE/ParE family toxin [Elusimicrobia bacterium]|nr:type II toxin-antitoxin system RelE/ParE family toxin [Elusimicrobiota bacterium]
MEPRRRQIQHYLANGKNIFEDWLFGLRDMSGRIAILKRIARVRKGQFGDHRSVGCGVWELRIHTGPGYRVYYGEDGPVIVLLLCAGPKDTQTKDIHRAHQMWLQHRRLP